VPQSSFEPSPLALRRSPEEQARDRDLGFGSVVSRESQQRLLNRDGSFNVRRIGLGFLESFAPYHVLPTISWAGFLGIISAIYVVLNLAFALAYLACGPAALLGAGAAMLCEPAPQ
jgi:inward rectifier potassium channel